MRTSNGPEFRKRRLHVHRQLYTMLEAGTTPHLDQADLRRANIQELTPLDWDHQAGLDSAPLYATPMRAEDFQAILSRRNQRFAELNCTDQRQRALDFDDPWAAAAWADHCDAGQLSSVGETWNHYFVDSLMSWDCHFSLTDLGGWRVLGLGDTWEQYAHTQGYLGQNSGIYRLRSIMQPHDIEKYRSHTWCAVADGTQGVDTPPDNTKLLRGEVCAALRIARDSVRLDKTYQFSSYPVIVISLSMFYVRILQICLQPANGKPRLTVRKTPYLHLRNRQHENITTVLRWYMGSPVQASDFLGELAEEDEEDEENAVADTGSNLPVIR